jgi:hypothetical protein
MEDEQSQTIINSMYETGRKLFLSGKLVLLGSTIPAGLGTIISTEQLTQCMRGMERMCGDSNAIFVGSVASSLMGGAAIGLIIAGQYVTARADSFNPHSTEEESPILDSSQQN